MSTSFQGYHPEMGEPRPADAQIDAQLGHYGRHWYLRTPLVLQGRGIVHRHTETAQTLTASSHHKIGWHNYKVTEAAFAAICKRYKVAVEMLLS